jgi:hypothetical protein
MKTTILVLIVFVSLAFSIGCTARPTESPVSPELKIPFYILIQQNDEVQEGGKLKYRVQKGDVLKVLMRKTCLDGYSECWKVLNMNTRVIGYVVARHMKELHIIRQSL